jgi:hypothetical protein
MASDNFNYTANPLGGSWTSGVSGFKSGGAKATPINFGPKQAAYYASAASGDDQFSQSTANDSPYTWAVAVRLQNSGGAMDGYCLLGGSGNGDLAYIRISDNGYSVLASSTGDTVAASDVIRLEMAGTTLSGFKNAGALSDPSHTDAVFTGGQPGIVGEFTDFDSHEDWSGGDLGGGGGGAAGPVRLPLMGVG